jgi:hypothetical protein
MNPSAPLPYRHLLATLAYRFQNALAGAPANFSDFSLGYGVRTPLEIVRHMNGLLGFAQAALDNPEDPQRPQLPAIPWDEEVSRFHELLGGLEADFSQNTHDTALLLRLLQGPLSDTMTHIGQLALLRRAAGSPVSPANFFRADIRTGNVSQEQS